jgi:hypothetical protein
MMALFLKSDSDPSGVWAETATVCLPGSNRIDSVVAEIPLGRPGWKKVLSAVDFELAKKG